MGGHLGHIQEQISAQCVLIPGDHQEGLVPWCDAMLPHSGQFGEGHGNPLQYFLPGRSHRQRSLEGYSSWGRKEWDATEWLSTQWPVYTAAFHPVKTVPTKQLPLEQQLTPPLKICV